MYLIEMMNTSVSYNWEEQPAEQMTGKATFTVNQIPYVVYFSKCPYKRISAVEFASLSVDQSGRSHHSTDVTNTGNQFVVISTVIKIIDDFVSQIDPYGLLFNATGQSRIRLYDTLVKRVRTHFPEVQREQKGDHVMYIIHKGD